jgi:hypothetical protein
MQHPCPTDQQELLGQSSCNCPDTYRKRWQAFPALRPAQGHDVGVGVLHLRSPGLPQCLGVLEGVMMWPTHPGHLYVACRTASKQQRADMCEKMR